MLALVIFFSSDGLVTFISGHCSFTLVSFCINPIDLDFAG